MCPTPCPRATAFRGFNHWVWQEQAAHLSLVSVKDGKVGAASVAVTSVALFDQGILQILQAAVTGLEPKQPYVLALAETAEGSGALQPLSNFMTNPAGAAIVSAIGPLRQVVQPDGASMRRYLVIAPQVDGKPGQPVQVQSRTP